MLLRHIRNVLSVAIAVAAPSREWTIMPAPRLTRSTAASPSSSSGISATKFASLSERNRSSKARWVGFFQGRQAEPAGFPGEIGVIGSQPRINLTRFHGCFAPNHRLRAQIVPAKRGRGARQHQAAGEWEKASPYDRLLPVRR
jgi:hypothetical protein